MTASRPCQGEIEAILYNEQDIAAAVARMAAAIAAHYARQPLVLVGVLEGASYFTADLARALSHVPDGPSEITTDFITVSSYGNLSHSSGNVRLLKDVRANLAGRNVVIVEDIVEAGLTLQYIQSLCTTRGARSLRSCVLLDKPYNRSVDVTVHYVGLTVPDAFIVGYGLDYQEKYRTLPYLAKLRSRVFSE